MERKKKKKKKKRRRQQGLSTVFHSLILSPPQIPKPRVHKKNNCRVLAYDII